MHILVSSDKFKGSLSAEQVANALTEGLLEANPSLKVLKQPLADGGEGTLEILSRALNLQEIKIKVNDPLFRSLSASYYRNHNTAFIEMACASGLQLLSKEEQNPFTTSTFGTGELIRHALENKATHIYLTLGGSATNDAGLGMAQALGVSFFGKGKRLNKVRGRDLVKIDVIDTNNLIDLTNVRFTVLCDVRNPLYGEQGAAKVYAAQKGANLEEVAELDTGLRNIARLVSNGLEHLSGAGAAGGLGYGAMTFLNAQLKPGIETIMEILDLESAMARVDLVITGEGKLDDQTLHGKVVAGVSKMAMRLRKPIVAVCGANELSANNINNLGISRVYEVLNLAENQQQAIENAHTYLIEIGSCIAQEIF